MANSIGQSLLNHSFAVGSLAKVIIQKTIKSEKLANLAFIAGCMHDVGKIDDSFQDWVTKASKKKLNICVPEEGEHIQKKGFSFEKYPRHNEISLMISVLLMENGATKINKKNKKRLFHAIYWSHAKPIRKDEFINLASIFNKYSKNGSESIEKLLEKSYQFIEELHNLDTSMNLKEVFKNTDIEEVIEDLRENNLPAFKAYYESNEDFENYQKDINSNAKNNLIRSALISADRKISSMSANKLNELVEKKDFERIFNEAIFTDSDLKSRMEECIKGFETNYPNNPRNPKQHEASSALAELNDGIVILNGAPGVGKTKTAIEWAVKTNAKKLFWICPRVDICMGIFNDLIQEDYLPNSKIELSTGDLKLTHKKNNTHGENDTYETMETFSGDVIITTVDQIINSIVTHKDITKLTDFMCSHVVFDEYHEYINLSGFNLLFSELIACKKMALNPNTLLVSATPNYCFVEDFLEIDSDNIINLDSFNETLYRIVPEYFNEDEDSTNPFFKKQEKGSINISNTANVAQRSFIDFHLKENALLYHAKYTKEDKQKFFNEMIDTFKKNGNKKYDSLRSGPSISASLNITCEKMLSEFSSAENIMQRIGRLGRFGENELNVMTIATPESIEKGRKNGPCARFLNHLHLFDSSMAWHRFAKEKIYNKEMKLKDIHALYIEFYQSEENRKSVEEDILKSLKEGAKNLNKNLMDPICIPKNSKIKGEDVKLKIKKNSLRGDNRFVQMSICLVKDRFNKDTVHFLNEYVYKEGIDKTALTLSQMKILGFGKSTKNLLSFMMKKHHNIEEGYKKPYSDFHLMSMARDPETPIFVSYTPEDLEKVNTESHPYAIYYIKTEKQNVGAMSINKLQE